MNYSQAISHSPVYQIDFLKAASGKHVSGSKRRVRWCFGFTNPQAIAEGVSGMNCRGEEHEVILEWSLSSGKRRVLIDGDEVFYAKGNRADIRIEATFPLRSVHILKIVAHAGMPMRASPGFRQFDLLVDGMSFFDMPCIFQLGQPLTGVAPYLGNTRVTQVRSSSAEVDHAAEISPVNTRSMSMPEMKTDVILNEQLDMSMDNVASLKILDRVDSPRGIVDEFAPVVVPSTPPSFHEVSKGIMSLYSPPCTDALSVNSGNYDLQFQIEPMSDTAATASPLDYFTQPGTATQPSSTCAHNGFPMTMSPLSIESVGNDSPTNDFDQALHSLVNLEDIKEVVESPEAVRFKAKAVAKSAFRSDPLPPTSSSSHFGNMTTLDEMKARIQPATPTKEIMKVHAFNHAAVQAGTMVVYGQTTQQPFSYGGFGVHNRV